MTKLHITILFMLLWSFSYSQQYTNYTTKDGLPSNHVYRITQDYQGFIWFITDKGMVKYDGTDFKAFTIRDGLPTNDIWNIATTPNGKIWYFSKSPKIGYIVNDSVYAFPSINKGEILNPTNRNVVGNYITFNNSFNHYELENGKWKAYGVSGSYSALKQYKAYLNHKKLHRLQFSKDKKHLVFIDKDNHEVKRTKVFQEILEAHTRSQVNDSTYIWVSNKGYVVLNLNSLDLKTNYFENIIRIKESKYTRIHVVNNQIQITGKGFVSVLDDKYDIKNTYYIPDYLKAHFSFIDKQDNLWIATFRNGVYKLPKSKRNATYSLINEKVGRIKKINNNLVTTVLDKGIYLYDKKTKQFKPYIKETNFTYGIYNIAELNKTFFITNKSIFSVNDKTKNLIQEFIRSGLNETARQLVYQNGNLYGNFTSGINKLNPKDLSVVKEYTLNGVRCFKSFKQKLIIATSNGLQILENDSIKILKLQTDIQNKVYKKPILCLNTIDDKQLLVGTDAYGAFITDLEKIIPLKETEYLSVNGSFVEENDLWLATDKGIWHYKKDVNNNYIFVTSYDENDGLLLSNTNAVYATDKSLIVSSNVGVVTIPKKRINSQQLLDIYISKADYKNQNILTHPAKYESNNTLNIKVSSIDYSEKIKFKYNYQLLPIQEKWITTSSNEIAFNNVPPNTYQLNIESKGKNKSVHFVIKPLWYQTLIAKLFFSLLAILFITVVILFVRKRELKKQAHKLNTKRKLAEFELHALRSQMNPHFVFNSLNAIQFYMNDNKIELSEKYLVKFSKLVRMFFDFSKQAFISIEDEIKLLNGYLEIEKLRFGEDFNFKISVKNKLNIQRKIPAMLLQPIVENAVNHGLFHKLGKGLISIVFKKIDKESFEVYIEDDGIGREQAAIIKQQQSGKHLSKSTHIIKDRIALLNESNKWEIIYVITDLKAKEKKGTRVTLVFKQTQI